MRAASPFARAVTSAVSAVATHSSVDHPLTTERENIRRSRHWSCSPPTEAWPARSTRRSSARLSSWPSSCGRRAKDVVFYLVGRKAVGYFQFRRMASAAQWVGDRTPRSSPPRRRSRMPFSRRTARWRERGCRRDPPRVQPLRQHDDAVARIGASASARGARGRRAPGQAEIYPLYEFEPDAETVLDALLPVYVQSRIFNALLQSSAAKTPATQKAYEVGATMPTSS